MRCWLAVSLFLAWVISVHAQPAFEVASIKPSAVARAGGEGSRWPRVSFTPTSLTLQNAGLAFCIQWAYNVRFYQVSGPAWITEIRYDILARTERPVTQSALRLMLQALLADRFQVAFHRETKTIPVYKLVAGKGATKLSQADADEATDLRVSAGSFVFSHTSMGDLAERLSGLAGMDRPVLDHTGIPGAFDITLPSAARKLLEDNSSIFASVQEIGLEMKPGRAPVEILVVDRAEKPSAN